MRGDDVDEAARGLRSFARAWRSAIHLRPQQVLLRPLAKVGLRVRGCGPLEHLRPAVRPLLPGCAKRSELRSPDTLRVLDVGVRLREGGWEPAGLPRLVAYNVHYFDWLFGGSSACREEHVGLIRRWVHSNPIGRGAGWEPYPTSLRLANWIRWFLREGVEPDREAVRSIASQAGHLRGSIEWHLMGNHVLANVKALVLAGLFFDGPSADGLRRFAERVLTDQLKEQLRPDGGHGELSPMYHALIAEDLLDLIAAYRSFGVPVPTAFREACGVMLKWLDAVTHPNGDYAQFNDTSLTGPAPSRDELLRYASRLGLEVAGEASAQVIERSGYVRAAAGRLVLIADCADVADDHLAGHAHADLLSFELSLDGERLVADTGVSTYEVGERRSLERSTAAHNTIEIDETSSCEAWAAFRTGRRGHAIGRSISEESGRVTITCAHDGYSFLPGCPIHRRTWRLRSCRLEVEDSVEGTGLHTLVMRLHLDPSLTAHIEGDSAVLSKRGVVAAIVDVPGWGSSLVVEDYQYARGFNRTERGACLVVRKPAVLPARARILISCSDGDKL